jgi:hypothetical protein
MLVNVDNFLVYFLGIPTDDKICFSTMFPYNHINIEDGMKNLGFVINLNDYLKKYQSLLIDKVERTNVWCHIWLSREVGLFV